MKRIAIIITRMDLGGAQQVALETAARLDPARFEARLYAGPGGALDAEARRRLGDRFVVVPSLVHPIRPHRDAAATLGLAWRLLRWRADLVHTHSSKGGMLGRAAGWAAGADALVHTVHGWSFNDAQRPAVRRAFAALEACLARETDALVAVAESCRDKGLLQGVADPARYRVIRAAVDLEAWRAAPGRAEARAALGLPPEARVVATVANLKPQKDPLTFVRAAAAARAAWRGPQPLVFVYAGGGPLMAEARALADRLGLGDSLRLLGWVDDPRAAVAACDVFLLASRFEGLPCVIPQAYALAKPVVATAVDGTPELVREGVTGFLAQPRDHAALAERVLRLLADPALAESMGRAGAASLGPEWGYAGMVRSTEALYEELLG